MNLIIKMITEPFASPDSGQSTALTGEHFVSFKKMHTKELIKSRTIKWLSGVILQSQRLLTQQPNVSTNQNGCDAHFFAISLANALYWLKKTDLNNLYYGSEGRKYLAEFAEGKNLRDMLEHDGDYIIGKGRKQSKYHITKFVNEGKLKIKGLAPFTLVHSNEGLSLGGRILIKEAHDLSVLLLNKISEQKD